VPDRFELTVFANLGALPVTVAPITPAGRLIAAVGEGLPEGLKHGTWPGWSVAWFLADGATPQ
jgi:hypothetical protein